MHLGAVGQAPALKDRISAAAVNTEPVHAEDGEAGPRPSTGATCARETTQAGAPGFAASEIPKTPGSSTS